MAVNFSFVPISKSYHVPSQLICPEAPGASGMNCQFVLPGNCAPTPHESAVQLTGVREEALNVRLPAIAAKASAGHRPSHLRWNGFTGKYVAPVYELWARKWGESPIWVMGQLILAMTAHPRPQVRSFLEAEARLLQQARRARGLLVGWHLRTGLRSDHHMDRGRASSFSSLRDAADRWMRWTKALHLSAQGPVGAVFVASDVSYLNASWWHNAFPHAPFRFVTMPRTMPRVTMTTLKSPTAMRAAGLEVLSDMTLLMSADAFLGSSSNWATPVTAAIAAAKPFTLSSSLCIVATDTAGAPLSCLGTHTNHKTVTHFFLPPNATRSVCMPRESTHP